MQSSGKEFDGQRQLREIVIPVFPITTWSNNIQDLNSSGQSRAHLYYSITYKENEKIQLTFVISKSLVIFEKHITAVLGEEGRFQVMAD